MNTTSSPVDPYCIIGNPGAHSRSPWIHARFAELTGQALHYERLLVNEGLMLRYRNDDDFGETTSAFTLGSSRATQCPRGAYCASFSPSTSAPSFSRR